MTDVHLQLFLTSQIHLVLGNDQIASRALCVSWFTQRSIAVNNILGHGGPVKILNRDFQVVSINGCPAKKWRVRKDIIGIQGGFTMSTISETRSRSPELEDL